VKVNGNSLIGADHLRAVTVLKETGNDVSVIVGRLVVKPVALSPTRTVPLASPSSGNEQSVQLNGIAGRNNESPTRNRPDILSSISERATTPPFQVPC